MKIFKSRLFKLLVLVASLILIVTLSRSVYNLWQRRDIVSQRARELARQKAENQRLKQKLSEVQTPEFVERQAREKLGLVKPGEVVVLVPKTEAGSEDQTATQPLPNWQKWWRLFF